MEHAPEIIPKEHWLRSTDNFTKSVSSLKKYIKATDYIITAPSVIQDYCIHFRSLENNTPDCTILVDRSLRDAFRYSYDHVVLRTEEDIDQLIDFYCLLLL